MPRRNQALIRSPLPTSHGFVAKDPAKKKSSPLPASAKSEFVNNFEFVGSLDIAHYFVVPEVVKWREEVCGGEEAIINYNISLAQKGGQIVADMLGTEILDNEEKTLTKCALVNIRLPLEAQAFDAGKTVAWVQETLIKEFETFLPIYLFQGTLYTRLSAQVWLEESDFVWAGERLKELCERAKAMDALKAVGAEKQQPSTLIGRVNNVQTE